MKAISLTQPWATLVVTGRKSVETRRWRTAFRGPVAIHASKAMPGWAKEAAQDFGLDPDALPRGAIIGEVTIVRTIPTKVARAYLSPLEEAMGDYDDGRWAWELTNPVAYSEPIPAVGHLGLWEWQP